MICNSIKVAKLWSLVPRSCDLKFYTGQQCRIKAWLSTTCIWLLNEGRAYEFPQVFTNII